jgi:predicted amino acid racemase
MLLPRIEIELDKLTHNSRKLIALYGSKGIRIVAVTKGVCGSPGIAHDLLKTIRSWGIEEVELLDTSRSPFIPLALKLPLMMATIAILRGRN